MLIVVLHNKKENCPINNLNNLILETCTNITNKPLSTYGYVKKPVKEEKI